MATTRSAVLGGFKRLMRARQGLFQSDTHALVASREAIRLEIMKNKGVTDEKQLGMMVKGLAEAEDMLRYNLVQGKLNERGNYAMKVSKDHTLTMQDRAELQLMDAEFADSVEADKSKPEPEEQKGTGNTVTHHTPPPL